MSLQYAKKRISDIQKVITYKELELIHEAATSSTRIPKGNVSYSIEKKEFIISIDIPSAGSTTSVLPAVGTLTLVKSPNSGRSGNNIKLSIINQVLVDQVHLWETYFTKRKRRMLISFVGVFIILVSLAIASTPYFISCYSAGKEGKEGQEVQYLHNKVLDTLRIKREVKVQSIEKKAGVASNTINRSANCDSSIISERVQISQNRNNGLWSSKDNKNVKHSKFILYGIIPGGMFFFFLFIYPIISIWVGLYFSKKLIPKIFCATNLFSNPDEK